MTAQTIDLICDFGLALWKSDSYTIEPDMDLAQ
jgi:hypothetical protein